MIIHILLYSNTYIVYVKMYKVRKTNA